VDIAAAAGACVNWSRTDFDALSDNTDIAALSREA